MNLSITAAVNRSAMAVNDSVPWLIIVEITLQPTRWHVPGVTDVTPRGRGASASAASSLSPADTGPP